MVAKQRNPIYPFKFFADKKETMDISDKKVDLKIFLMFQNVVSSTSR